MNSPWSMTYRPDNLEELVLPDDLRKDFEKWLREDKAVPHLIFLGQAGTGKTSIGNVIVNELKARYIVLNSSDERGMDVVREQIKTFAMTASGRIKIVFLDEADRLTNDAQQTLRNIMETYVGNTRFIFTGNYDKFIEPLKDKCTIITLYPMPRHKMLEIVKRILLKEAVTFEEKDVMDVIDELYPSLRSILDSIQNNIYTENGYKRFSFKKIELTELEQLMEKIYKTFTKYGASEARKVIIENEIDRWEMLYRYFFDRGTTPVERLIVSEYLSRHYSVLDKELNFSAMMFAYESGLLPYSYFPEVQAVRMPSRHLLKVEETNKREISEEDVERLLHELSEV
jgi:DNA polymerase III delta prime subunit